MVFFGWLSDRIGRRPILLGGALLMGLVAFPWVWLISTPSVPLTLARYLVLCLAYCAMWGTAGVYFAEPRRPAAPSTEPEPREAAAAV